MSLNAYLWLCFLRYVSLVLVALTLVTCSKAYDYGDRSTPAVPVDVSNPSWSNGIQNVIKEKCVNCHTPAAQRSKFVPGNTPSTIDNINSEGFFADSAKSALVQSRVFNDAVNPMPPKFATPLTTEEKLAFKTWLDSKVTSLDSICGTTGTSTWTFRDAITVINAECASCHNGSSHVAFDSVAKVKTYRSSMVQYLNKGSMPPSDATFKSSTSGAKLFNWLCFGSDVH